MRKGYAAGWVMAGIMSVLLVGCQAEEAVRETETGAETVTEAGTDTIVAENHLLRLLEFGEHRSCR